MQTRMIESRTCHRYFDRKGILSEFAQWAVKKEWGGPAALEFPLQQILSVNNVGSSSESNEFVSTLILKLSQPSTETETIY